MLRKSIASIGREAGAEQVAAAFFDYETETLWSYHGDRWFHAASTIKVALLVCLYEAIAEGRFSADSRLHVRNRFLSVLDGAPFRVPPERDANAEVHAAIGKSMKLYQLASHMIVTSSNLATNLLLDLVGVPYAGKTLERLGVKGVALRRGVEDERAYEAGIYNEITALGLLRLFRMIQDGKVFEPEHARDMLDILRRQEFRSGIPAGLPPAVRERAQIAHKTGEISTVAHDAGIVHLPDRAPYVVAILTEWPAGTGSRQETVARISRLIYDHLLDEAADA